MYKRYNVITFDHHENGADSKDDFRTIREAIKAVHGYLKHYEAAFIYDYQENRIRHAFNHFPDGIFAKDVSTAGCIYHFA